MAHPNKVRHLASATVIVAQDSWLHGSVVLSLSSETIVGHQFEHPSPSCWFCFGGEEGEGAVYVHVYGCFTYMLLYIACIDCTPSVAQCTAV